MRNGHKNLIIFTSRVLRDFELCRVDFVLLKHRGNHELDRIAHGDGPAQDPGEFCKNRNILAFTPNSTPPMHKCMYSLYCLFFLGN